MRFSTKQYFIKETYKSIRRNGFMSFASISTVAVSLLVLGMFLMIFLNTNNLAQYLENQVQISVYMQDSATDKELASVKDKLTKCQAWSRLRRSASRRPWSASENA